MMASDASFLSTPREQALSTELASGEAGHANGKIVASGQENGQGQLFGAPRHINILALQCASA